jgi:hypothetical protein
MLRPQLDTREMILRSRFLTGPTDRAKAEQLIKVFYAHFRIAPAIYWIDRPRDVAKWLSATNRVYRRQEGFLRSAYEQSISYACQPTTPEFVHHNALAKASIFPRLIRQLLSEFFPVPGDITSATLTKFSTPMLVGLETIADIVPLYNASMLRSLAALFREFFGVAFGVILRTNDCVLIPNLDQVALNANGDLSAQDGPALRIGAKTIFAVEGIVVPTEIAERAVRVRQSASPGDHPDAGKLVADMHESLYRRRRETYTLALIELLGWKAFIKMPQTSKYRTIRSRSAKLGVLYEVVMNGLSHLFILKVTNATAHPDGTFEDFYLRVDAELRPLPDPTNPRARRGVPQEINVLNAVASTWGMTGFEYRAILGAQS